MGKTFFHDWQSEPPDDQSLAKRSLLQALAVEVIPRDCSEGFEAAYNAFIKTFCSLVVSSPEMAKVC